MLKFSNCFFAAALAVLTGCVNDTTSSIPAVTNLDVPRYLGKWYEYARLPNLFEKDMTKVSAIYSMRDDGNIKVVNCGYKDEKQKCITGIAKKADKSNSGELKVSFFRPFYSRYRIIKLAPDYSWAVVTGKQKKYLWILSRTKNITPEAEKEIFTFLKQNGYPLEKLIFAQ